MQAALLTGVASRAKFDDREARVTLLQAGMPAKGSMLSDRHVLYSYTVAMQFAGTWSQFDVTPPATQSA